MGDAKNNVDNSNVKRGSSEDAWQIDSNAQYNAYNLAFLRQDDNLLLSPQHTR